MKGTEQPLKIMVTVTGGSDNGDGMGPRKGTVFFSSSFFTASFSSNSSSFSWSLCMGKEEQTPTIALIETDGSDNDGGSGQKKVHAFFLSFCSIILF